MENAIRLWMMLPEAAWRSLNYRGYLICDDEALGAQDFLTAYRWMMQQMQSRIGPAETEIKLPLWAWYQHAGRRKKSIALKHRLPKHQKGYRVECHLPQNQVLLSDFHLWHQVLNNTYLPENQVDDEAFDRDFGDDTGDTPDHQAKKQKIIEASWRRIFDLDWYNEYACIPEDQKTIQACFWRLELSHVKHADVFISR